MSNKDKLHSESWKHAQQPSLKPTGELTWNGQLDPVVGHCQEKQKMFHPCSYDRRYILAGQRGSKNCASIAERRCFTGIQLATSAMQEHTTVQKTYAKQVSREPGNLVRCVGVTHRCTHVRLPL